MKLPNVTVKIPEKTALDIALGAAQEHLHKEKINA